ncbi:MAG: hypothetical protein AAF628_08610 [Planctomycetota bacterium]
MNAPRLVTAAVGSLSLFAGTSIAQVTVTLEPSRDVTLFEDTSGRALANGAGSQFCVGVDAAGRRKRGVLAFDVSGIPSAATITSVSLQVVIAMNIDYSPRDSGLHRVTQDWGEAGSLSVPGLGGGQCGGGAPMAGDATWTHTFFPGSTWATPGGDFDATASATTSVGITVGAAATWASTAQLVADVQGWVTTPGTNFGWLMLGDESLSPTARAFFTREDATAAQRPQLTVTYDEPTAAIASVGTGCSGSGASNLSLQASGLPQVPNPSFSVSLSGGPAGPIRGYALSFALSPVPIPLGGGCSIFVGLPFATIIPALGPTLPLPVPNNPDLLGASFPLQGLALDAAPTLFVTSNALNLTFGR